MIDTCILLASITALGSPIGLVTPSEWTKIAEAYTEKQYHTTSCGSISVEPGLLTFSFPVADHFVVTGSESVPPDWTSFWTSLCNNNWTYEEVFTVNFETIGTATVWRYYYDRNGVQAWRHVSGAPTLQRVFDERVTEDQYYDFAGGSAPGGGGS